MASERARIRRELYGPDRAKVVEEMRSKLTKDSVLQPGEYNNVGTGPGTWSSITTRDYGDSNLGGRVPPEWEVRASYQNRAHFDMRAEDGPVHLSNYQVSATHHDFNYKPTNMPVVHGPDLTVRWPDMAPQFATNRNLSESTEYKDSFPRKMAPGPFHPRVETGGRQTPAITSAKTRKYRGVHVELGDEDVPYESEMSDAYNHLEEIAKKQGQGSLVERMRHAKELTKFMRQSEITSNVFREGDYNGAAQAMASIQCMDYNKRDDVEPNRMPEANDGSKAPLAHPAVPGLIKDSLQIGVKNTWDDALKGRADQNSAHFFLGDETSQPTSVYTKDFRPGGRTVRSSVGKSQGPPGSQVLQRDDDQKVGDSVTGTEYGNLKLQMAPSVGNAEMKNLIDNKLRLYKDWNFNLSYDRGIGKQDRQVSLSHGDFRPPPASFKPMAPIQGGLSKYDYTNTDNALSYKVSPEKSTDNKTNYSSTLKDGPSSIARRRMKDHLTKSRLHGYLDTHFDIGYEPMRFNTHHNSTFEGRPLGDQHVPAAGKTIKEARAYFDHVGMTDNQRDLEPDPFFMFKKGKVTRADRAITRRSMPALPVHKASIMTNDFQPIERRYMTQAQLNLLRHSHKLDNPATAPSHLFHTDTSGVNQMRTVSMRDFIKPEDMKGQQLVEAI